MKKLLILFLTLFLSLSLAACSDNEKSMNSEEIKETLIKNVANIKNYDVNAVTNLSMKISNEDSTRIFSSTGSIFLDPYKVKLNVIVNLDTENNPDQVMDLYSEKPNDTKLYYRVIDGNLSNNTGEDGRLGDLSQYDILECSKVYVENSENFKVNKEKLEEKDIYKVEATVKKDSIGKVVGFSKALDPLLNNNFSSSSFDSLYEEVETLPITLWVDSETLYPVKYEIDMTEIVQKVLSNITVIGEIQEPVIKSPICTYTITFSNYNNAPDFEIPKQ